MIGRPESILDAMESSGFSPDESAHEINLALQSPYVKGSELLRTGCRSETGCWRSIERATACIPRSAEIERRHKLSRDEFLREYYCTNRPVIITGMMDDWPAMRKWNLDYFAGTVRRPRGRGADGPDRGRQLRNRAREIYASRIRFGDFVEKVRTAGETNDFYLTANNNSSNRKVLPELWDDIVQIPEYLRERRSGRLLLDGPGRHDHAVPPRPDQQLHGAGDRSQASQDRSVVGHAPDAQLPSLLFAGRRTRPARRAASRR